MGLDMYLTANVYVGGCYHHILPKDIKVAKTYKNDKSEYDFTDCQEFPTENLEALSFRVGYWRKANQIHRWFVENVQGGNDNCKKYIVPQDFLVELKKVCGDIFSTKDKEKALKVLPPQDGFYFGCSDPNAEGFWGNYWDDIEITIKNLDNALKFAKKYNADVYYESSW